jgi:hypothetical protein
LNNLINDPAYKKTVKKLVLVGEPLFLFEDEDVFVLENVKATHERAVSPKLFLISLCASLFEVLDDDALERIVPPKHFVHTVESQR